MENLIYSHPSMPASGQGGVRVGAGKTSKVERAMIVTYSKNKVPIRLTIERWNHIIHRHPELIDEKEKVIEAIEKPEVILMGDFGTLMAAKFYQETPLSKKYLVVIYKELNENDGFVVTAYFTNKPSEWREVLWKQ